MCSASERRVESKTAVVVVGWAFLVVGVFRFWRRCCSKCRSFWLSFTNLCRLLLVHPLSWWSHAWSPAVLPQPKRRRCKLCSAYPPVRQPQLSGATGSAASSAPCPTPNAANRGAATMTRAGRGGSSLKHSGRSGRGDRGMSGSGVEDVRSVAAAGDGAGGEWEG